MAIEIRPAFQGSEERFQNNRSQWLMRLTPETAFRETTDFIGQKYLLDLNSTY